MCPLPVYKSPCLEKDSGFFYNMKLKEQTLHILHVSNKEYREKWKATFTKQVQEILHIPNPR